jgi:hypothetical protein
LCGGEELTLAILYKILDELDDLLLPYTMDLSIFLQINDPDVIEHIRRVGVTFFETETENVSEKERSNLENCL